MTTDGVAKMPVVPCLVPAWVAMIAAVMAVTLIAGAPAWAAEAFVHINTPSLTLIPSALDYTNDFVDATGSSGIDVKVKTNSPTGLILKVRSSGAGNTIQLGDLLVRTLTPAGAGGVALASWTPLALTDLNLWSIGGPQGPFVSVAADVRIRNLGGYDDNPNATYTYYSHTLVFTVVSP